MEPEIIVMIMNYYVSHMVEENLRKYKLGFIADILRDSSLSRFNEKNAKIYGGFILSSIFGFESNDIDIYNNHDYENPEFCGAILYHNYCDRTIKSLLDNYDNTNKNDNLIVYINDFKTNTVTSTKNVDTIYNYLKENKNKIAKELNVNIVSANFNIDRRSIHINVLPEGASILERLIYVNFSKHFENFTDTIAHATYNISGIDTIHEYKSDTISVEVIESKDIDEVISSFDSDLCKLHFPVYGNSIDFYRKIFSRIMTFTIGHNCSQSPKCKTPKDMLACAKLTYEYRGIKTEYRHISKIIGRMKKYANRGFIIKYKVL